METNLKGLLKKFDQFLPYEGKVRNAVIQAVQEMLGTTLERQKIRVSGPMVFLSCTSSLRSEIAIRQVKITARINEIDPTLKIQKIQ